jgi:hypothetical protein
MFPRVNSGRYTARIEGDFVVFMIGMRINKPWLVREWGPTFVAMPRMLRELDADSKAGLLGWRLAITSPISVEVIQYWRSFEQLEAFARDAQRTHLPAWKAFRAATGDGGNVGIWHETFRVRAGEHESIYGNMPVRGLAAAGEHIGLGSTSRASERIG